MTENTLANTQTLAEHLDDPGWVVFDCRFSLQSPDDGRNKYHNGHIPGAHYADLDRDLASPKLAHTGRHPLPDSDVFITWLSNKGLNRDSQVVVYDDMGGIIAVRLWWMLRMLGHRSVAVLDGGWPAWTSSGHPVVTDEPMPNPGNFSAVPQHGLWISTDDVEHSITDSRTLIVDARAAPRFKGEHEPIDPVAGHVPGAVNHPCNNNLDDRGFFLAPEQLRQNFQELLEGRETADVVNMCGSGVTACHNILAMEIAGWTGTRLYVGSWSEWIADPRRTVETSVQQSL